MFVMRCSMSLFMLGRTRSKNALKKAVMRAVDEFPMSFIMTTHFVCSRLLRR